jgi:hypothetical protein
MLIFAKVYNRHGIANTQKPEDTEELIVLGIDNDPITVPVPDSLVEQQPEV